MAVIDVYLSLGSNLGNRERNLKIALNFLELTLGTHFTGISEPCRQVSHQSQSFVPAVDLQKN